LLKYNVGLEMEWESVIGLEVHIQLLTKSKIFSGASTAYGAEPNTQACAIDLGLPGVLPVLNGEAVKMAIKFGLAVSGEIVRHSVFSRKNYFYPDLPKGYQISQFDLPVVAHGHMDIQLDGETSKRINIVRAHLEEDAGKSLHELHGLSGIDLNRAGTPLLEIVSAPDMRSAKEAVIYLKILHTLVRYLGICDGNMQEGSFRCDANVSVKRPDDKELGTRAEIKNLNSFRFVERAINYEIQRQIALLSEGKPVIQETRLYDSDKHETRSMRTKEQANDYRYFPDPDLLPLEISEELINTIQANLPELPKAKQQRFQQQYELSAYDAAILANQPLLADYFEQVLTYHKELPAKLAANWITGDLMASLNRNNLDIADSPITAEQLSGLLQRIADQTISGKLAKTIFEAMWQKEGSADQIIDARGLKQMTNTTELSQIIAEIIKNNPEQHAQYKAGKDKLFAFFVGQVMKATQGKANPQQVNEILQEKLKE